MWLSVTSNGTDPGLASKYTLLWQPVVKMTAEATVAVLSEPFAAFGAPLLLKADNGAPFHAQAMANFLAAMQVQVLYSPACTPRYNRAIEAGIESLKTRTRQQAARHGRAAEWTCDNVEAARLEANTLSYPFGETGLAADGPDLAVSAIMYSWDDICDRKRGYSLLLLSPYALLLMSPAKRSCGGSHRAPF
jgi:hypothetical protein